MITSDYYSIKKVAGRAPKYPPSKTSDDVNTVITQLELMRDDSLKESTASMCPDGVEAIRSKAKAEAYALAAHMLRVMLRSKK